MKKQIISGIGIIACVALCANLWQLSTEVKELPAEPIKNAVFGEIEARSEETPLIFISEDVPKPETEVIAEDELEDIAEAVAESGLKETIITAEEKTEKAEPMPTAAQKSQAASKSASASTKPKSGDRTVIDGMPHIWIPGCGWIVDEGGGSVGTMVDGKGDINKIVGIMGGGTVAEDMYESGVKIGIMGGDETVPNSASPPTYTEPEITGDEIYVPLQSPVTKDSTPPAFKPNGEPYIHKDKP